MQRGTLIVIQAIATLLWPLWILTAVFAPMFFTNGITTQALVLLGLCVMMPLLSVVLSVAMWVGYRRSQPNLARNSAIGLLIVQLPLLLFVL